MDWGDIKNVIGKAAPLLGTVVGGPAGGMVGSLLASAFGVQNEPDAIHAAIKANPEAAVRLREIELDDKTELERFAMQNAANILAADTTRIESVNETMRQELHAESWYQRGWRPFWGFVAGTAFFVVCCFVCYLAYEAISGKNPEAITMIPQLVSTMTLLFSIPGAILGVTAWHRGQGKREQIKLNVNGKQL